ncbi:MAG: nitroreductase family protein [Acidobacteriota bacterium]|nr:nitroreductase family protein [Acidobacteriota bacterium]
MTVAEAIRTRRAVRSYADEPLDEATIRRLLDAAVQAPTAMHVEPWAFVVVQDRARLRRLSDLAKAGWAAEARRFHDLHMTGGEVKERQFLALLSDPAFCIFYDAPALVVICGRAAGPFVPADCWLAAENLMLAATAEGLGTCCIGSAVAMLNQREVKLELQIPADASAVAPIILGVPRGPVPPVSRKPPEILAWFK